MSLLQSFGDGLATAFELRNLLYCFIGVFMGTLVGVLPGIGALASISMLMPLTFYVPPDTALIMLAGIYFGTQYGGSTTSILLNLPGTPSASVVCLDGYPMSKQGRAGTALAITTIASFFGATTGILILMLFAQPLSSLGLSFAAADYFSLMVLGLVVSSTIASGSPAKGMAMVLVGLALGLVGSDIQTGTQRFTFGFLQLADGINLVALSMGLFGVAEVIGSLRRSDNDRVVQKVTMRELMPSRRDLAMSFKPFLRGAGIGSFIGALPGAGSNLASFMAYASEKKVASEPSRFGSGAIEGIAAPESANNAAAQTAFVPTLTLGIPGDAVMALMLGVLIMHGIQPGPRLISEQPQLFWGLIASFWVGNIMLVVLNLPLIGIWVRFLSIPGRYLRPAILVFMCIGVYSINNSAFDLFIMILFGLVGYIMRYFDYEAVPLILGFILGPLMEQFFRRAMILSSGDAMVFIERSTSLTFLSISLFFLLFMLYSRIKRRMRNRDKEMQATSIAGS